MIHISGRRARHVIVLLLLALAGLPGAVPAARCADLYAASAPAPDGPAAGNTAAFGAALRQVLVKVSGRQAAGEQAVVASFGDPAALVQQFRRDAAGNLWAQFDPAAVRRGLARANLSAWGEDRPTTLVWLVWDSGAGEIDLVSGSATGGTAGALRQQLLEAAEARGVPVMLPLRDAPDLAAVGAADALGDPHDDGLHDLALLHAPLRDRLLDGDDDDVAEAGVPTPRAAQHLDALDALRAGVVGDLEDGAHLDHDVTPPRTS